MYDFSRNLEFGNLLLAASSCFYEALPKLSGEEFSSRLVVSLSVKMPKIYLGMALKPTNKYVKCFRVPLVQLTKIHLINDY